MDQINIVVTGQIPEAGIELLLEKGYNVIQPQDQKAFSKKNFLEKAENADGILTLLSDTIDKSFIDKTNKLKVIANFAVGYNNIDIDYAKEKGIPVTNTPDVLTAATADLTWALILSVTKRIVESDTFTRSKKFTGWEPLLFLGGDVTGKTLGIIGAGRIGQAVAKRATGFDMKIIYYNPSPKPEFEKATGAVHMQLDDLLEQSDFISLHCPLTESTQHLLNVDNLKKMKPSAYIINTSRGPVIDEQALTALLSEERIAGAGFDVYENEPEINKGLYSLPNVVLLPHIGSATVETRNEMSRIAARNIISVIEGRGPINPVN